MHIECLYHATLESDAESMMESRKTETGFAANLDATGAARFGEATKSVLQEMINCKKDLKILQRKVSKMRVEAATTLAGLATLHDPFMRHQLAIAYQSQDNLLTTLQKQESVCVDKDILFHDTVENTDCQEVVKIFQESMDGGESSSDGIDLQSSEENVSLCGKIVKDVCVAGYEFQIRPVSEQQEGKEVTNELVVESQPEREHDEYFNPKESMNPTLMDVLGEVASLDLEGNSSLVEVSSCQEMSKAVTALEMIAGYSDIAKSPE
ncbi:uncharacterized protein [Macrobrachium rosenbergii]|uniref:uncharacterized protein isoform X3 n=1 Tax=Macrobrachium rosenbergii TaxID=79674 RepID=UPI0034D62FF0